MAARGHRGDGCVAESPSSVVGRGGDGCPSDDAGVSRAVDAGGDGASVESGRVACGYAFHGADYPCRALCDARRGGRALGSAAGSERPSRSARRDCWWWPPGGDAGGAALRARPVGLGAHWWLGLDVPSFSRVGCRWGVRLVGAPCSPGRGAARGLGGVRAERGVVRGVGCVPLVLERDWPPVDDCVPGSDACLCRAVPGARSCGRALRGRDGLRPHCARRVGAHRSRVRYLRRDGTYTRSR